MPVLGDETGGLGEGAVLVLHDEATLLPVAQQDGKLRLGAMNLTDVLNLSLVKGVMNVEKKIAHTGSMTHRAAVCIYRLLHLIAEETHLAPQIILHAPYDEILYCLLPLLAIRQIKHHRAAETIRQTTLGKLGVRLVVSQLSHLHYLILQALDKLASLTALLETAGCIQLLDVRRKLRLKLRIITAHLRTRSEIGTDDGGKRQAAHGSISHLTNREELLRNGNGARSILVETGLYAGCNALGSYSLLAVL